MHEDEEVINDKENIDVPAQVREAAREKRFLASVPPLPFVPSLHDHSRASGVFRSLAEERRAEEAAATSALAACPGLALWLKAILPATYPDVLTNPHLLADGALVAVVALHFDGFAADSSADAAALFSCVHKMTLMASTNSNTLNNGMRRMSREHRVRRRNWELLRRGFVAAQRGFLLTASDVSALVACDDVACVGLGAAVLARLFEYATSTGLTSAQSPRVGTSVESVARDFTSAVVDDSVQSSSDSAVLVEADPPAQSAPAASAHKPTTQRNHWAIVRQSLARIALPRQLAASSEDTAALSENPLLPSMPHSNSAQDLPVEASAVGFVDQSSSSSSSALSTSRSDEFLKPAALPAGKRFHFFVSHKKWHSSLGCSAEALAVLLKSVLEERGFVGCLDLDDIFEITSASFRDKVASSVCMLALLNDETAQSKWCVEEWKLAQQYGVPVVAIFNQDEQSLREIRDVISKLSSGAAFTIDSASGDSGPEDNTKKGGGSSGNTSSGSGDGRSGMPWLFEHQTVQFTSSHRRTCFNHLCERLNKFTKLATPQRPCFTRLAACEAACAAALADLPPPLADALHFGGSEIRGHEEHGGVDSNNGGPVTGGEGSVYFTARCQARFNVHLHERARRRNRLQPEPEAPAEGAATTSTFDDVASEGEIWPWADVTPAAVLDLLRPLPCGRRGPPSDHDGSYNSLSSYGSHNSSCHSRGVASTSLQPLSVAAAAQEAAKSLQSALKEEDYQRREHPQNEHDGTHEGRRGSRALAVCAALLRAVLRALGPPAAGGGGLDAHAYARFCRVLLVEALTRGTPFALAAAIRAEDDEEYNGNNGGAPERVSVVDEGSLSLEASRDRSMRHRGRSPQPPRSISRPRTPPPPCSSRAVRPGFTPPPPGRTPNDAPAAAGVAGNGTGFSSCAGAYAALSALPAFSPPLSPAVLCGPKSLRPYLLAATSLHAHLPADFQFALLSTAATMSAFPAQLSATQNKSNGAAALSPAEVAIKAAIAATEENRATHSSADSSTTGLFGKCAGAVFNELDTNQDGQLSLTEVAILLAHPMASRGFNWPSSGTYPPVSATNAELFVCAFRQLSNPSVNGAATNESAVSGSGVGSNMSRNTPASMPLGSSRGKRCSSMLQAGQVQSEARSMMFSPSSSALLSQEGGEIVVEFEELEAMLRLTVLLQALCSLNRSWLQQASRS